MKLTKQNIEQFANEIMEFLTKHYIDSDVCIYFNNKRIRNEYDWINPDEKPKLIVEDNINPFDYFEYANYDHILSMSFEGPLYDDLNYNFRYEEKLLKIFEKYGCYWELGNSWNLSAYPIDDDSEIEFTPYARPKKVIDLFMWDRNIPTELRKIMNEWYALSEAEGDKGSCVIGAGFSFEWNGNKYFMNSCSPWQGSISWESHNSDVKQMLVKIGATNIQYNWGRLD